jgi:AcrR family transcriptional regulator
MDEVANQLGISKKTIYQFYTDKDALVEDVIDIELSSSEKMCKAHRHKSENPVHEIFMAMDMVLDIFSRMNPALIFDMEKYHPKAFKKYHDYKEKFLYTMVKENLEAGISEGLYREDIQVDILSRFRLASVFLALNPEVFHSGRHNPGVVIKEITDNFLWGLATHKGQKLIQKYKLQRQKPQTL